MDFGATATTGMHVSCVAALREAYGLETKPVKVHEPYQMLGLIEDDLAEAMGVDTVGVMPPKTLFGFGNESWKEWRTPWGQEVLISAGFEVKEEGGAVFVYPQSDRSAAPSGHMPEGGYFFDTIVRQEPIDEENLDPEDNLEEFGPISEDDLQHYRYQVTLAEASGRGIVATLPGCALGDIALVPAPFLKNPKGIRDIAEWYMTTAMRPDYVHTVFERQTEIALENLKTIHEAVGNAFDVVFLCGTDFGTQTGSFCSPQTFDELWLPYYKQINGWIHKHTTWKTFKHSCGAVEGFMDHFIEAGFDIINPVQISATGMDPSHLKERYGDRLTFWGGGVDTQQVLPYGTPDEVRDQVRLQCETLSGGGGFVFDAVHNVQALTPTKNILAMVETVRAFNG
jgi:hypothetical protein